MKKLFITISLFVFIAVSSFGQEIKYEKNLDDALALSAKNFKPIFICLNIPPLPPSVKLPANVASSIPITSGLTSLDVIDLYKKNFNCYETVFTDTAGARLRTKYHITRFPAYIFFRSAWSIAICISTNKPSFSREVYGDGQ